MKTIRESILVLFIAVAFTTVAQQDPQYTQYMYNQAVINPAYAGSKDGVSLVSLYRNQWTGFEGAPKTMTFSGHSPIGENIGIGLSFISDKLGPVKENNIYADVSYTINITRKTKLAFGAKTGFTLHNIGLYSDVVTQESNDDAFSEDSNSSTVNVGLGLFLYSDNYYVGASIPNMLKSTHLDANGSEYGTEELHYFLTAGYVFQLTENTKFKPSFLVKSELESALSFDVNANFLFYDKFEIGASYRNEDSFSGLVGFAFSENIRIGYAYDHILTDINVEAKASHEVFLQFDLNFPKKVSRSPRFF